MLLRKRDLGFIALVGSLLLVLFLNSLREKPKSIPDNDRHRPFLDALGKGEKRAIVEKGCVNCHNVASRPLPQKHPLKEQCLICHTFKQTH